jgi:RHS repeat-associated protein
MEIAAPGALRSIDAKRKRRKTQLPSFCRLRRQTALWYTLDEDQGTEREVRNCPPKRVKSTAGAYPVIINLRNPGQYFDQETGLFYNVARYYNSQSGRYISSGPIGFRGGFNTYAYVRGNPLPSFATVL